MLSMPTKAKKTEDKTRPTKAKAAKTKAVKEPTEAAVTEGSEATTESVAEFSEQSGKTNGPEKYYEAIGRRKEATARVRVYTKKANDVQPSEDRAIITVNGKPYYDYFRVPLFQSLVEAPLKKLKSINRFKATVKVLGGGSSGQADAIKHGLSRALVLFDTNFSKKLRKAGYLTRDAREKERRKYGLKKARKSPQWSKR